MTLEQTRQLGIEFERRVQTMIPEEEFITKLDTETIYSYLNQYQDKLIHDLYGTVDRIPQSNSETYIETLLNSLMSQYTNVYSGSYIPDYGNLYVTILPGDFGLYIDSYSNVRFTYRRKGLTNNEGNVANRLIEIKDLSKAMPKSQDDMKILREPIVCVFNPDKITGDKRISALYDRYTKPNSITINYYRIPNYMDLMTSTPCELPMEMFEPLVSGAVDLYVQYVAGAEARKRQINEQQRQQQKQKNEDE